MLAAEFDIYIPAAPVNYWPWIIGIAAAIVLLAATWWIVGRKP